jgi:hypothetical protein
VKWSHFVRTAKQIQSTIQQHFPPEGPPLRTCGA